MAHQRRSPTQRTCSTTNGSPPSSRRAYPLRRTHSRTSSHALPQSISSPIPTRPVLVPLHNLRRLPSRTLLTESRSDKDTLMRESNHPVQVGAKRKRVASSNENAHNHGRPTRSSQKRKRTSTTLAKRYASTSEESDAEASDMELDPPSRRWPTDDESEEEDDETHDDDDGDEADSTDDYLLYSAPHARLNRLKKGELVRLYRLGALPEDPELLTKAEIIQVIIDARTDETASLPPSSPPGRTEAASSDYSSDDGNVAGDEDEQAEPEPQTTWPTAVPLRRRSTVNEVSKTPCRPIKGRSMSLGHMLHPSSNATGPSLKRKGSLKIITETSSRQRSGNRASPSTSAIPSAVSQKSLRSRKVSAPTPVNPSLRTPTSTSSSRKGKGKAKQVEFIDELPQPKASSRRHSKEKAREKEWEAALAEESDLTELEELEAHTLPQPSPRRLRSKDRERPQAAEKDHYHADAETTPTPKRKGHVRAQSRSSDEHQPSTKRAKRVVPMRRAKGKIKSLRESDLEMGSQSQEDEDEEDELEIEEEIDEEEEGEEQAEEDVDEEEEEEGEEEEEDGEEPLEVDSVDEENEVDELVSTGSRSPAQSARNVRRTPLRQRLRHRKDADEENEGDDELEVEEDEDAEVAEESEEVVEDDEETIAVEEPRRLRNGKIVGDEDVHMDDDENEETAEEDAGDDGSEDEHQDEGDEDIELDHEDNGEVTDDDVDLTVATAKTLTRLRKDDLVRLCESRNLETVGNKRKLAEALLQWRDHHAHDFSSPSSTGTVRPPSTTKRGRKKRSSASTVPVLLRSQKDQIHTDEPRTPVPGKEKDAEELELDLESLGLEDREIPPEKIVKLEKIGSGGFKDVFIGKFKGRRIAISEFRGTLSAMDIKELKLLGGFDHPNIVRFLGVSIPENTKETPVMIVSELCSNGDLFDYIRNVNAPSLHKVLRIMLDIASGLEYLHMRTPSVIHRDCKSSNILITAKGTAKIADFGLAKVKESTRSMVRSLVGTVNWQAPELWTAHPNYNHKVDVFSCAMVFWEMMQWHVPNKKFPWEGMNEHAIYDIVGAKKQRPSMTGLRKQWCPEIVDLVEHMWAQDPRDRPTMTEVVTTLRELVNKY